MRPQRGEFVAIGYVLKALVDLGSGWTFRIDLDGHRLPHMSSCQAAYLRRYGCGEESGLAAGRSSLQDAFDRGKEADIKHTIGFVEDGEVHAVEPQRPTLKKIFDPAGSADNGMRATLQGVDLAC